MEREKIHIPVLKEKIIEYLKPKKGEKFIDATFGGGGHTKEILKKIKPEGKVLAIDLDEELVKIGKENFKEEIKKGNLILVQGNFKNLKEIAKKYGFNKVSGIIFDLGLSLWHIEKSKKGFSYRRDEPLKMVYSEKEAEILARDIVNRFPRKEIEKILKEFGEEKYASRIAKEIIREREKAPIETTLKLVEIIKKVYPKRSFRRLHPARRSFQALRIAVNKELENLKKALPQAIDLLKKGGKICVISFHSLEDRIVKNFFKEKEKERKIKVLTKKPEVPSLKEKKENPRSRSAKLRVAQKI